MNKPVANSYWEKVALKLVPTRKDVGRSELRLRIAAALEQEVNAALARQLEKEFPDLEKKRSELAAAKEECVRERQRLSEYEATLRGREDSLARRESNVSALAAAFAGYMAWLDGQGDVDENGKRFNALREAYRAYTRKENA